MAAALGAVAGTSLQPSRAAAAEVSPPLLEEVVVTARKREENLLSVPISMSVASGEALQVQAISRLESLSAAVPSFHFAESVAGNDQIFMRGVGSGVNLGFENSVGQVFDGFFFGRGRYGRSLFMDIAQVEILKGPQGALIGKNTTAGVINIRTARPTATFESYLIPTWEFEGDKGYSLEGALSGPFSERLRGRLALRYEDKDGYVENVVRHKKEMARQIYDVRGILEADVTATLSATLLYQHDDQQRDGRGRELLHCSAAVAAALAPTGEDCQFDLTNTAINLHNGVEVPATTNTQSDIAGLTLNWSTAIGTVTSLSGYSRYNVADNWDGDLTAFEGTSLNIDESYHQWSEELRLVSNSRGPVDYMAGLYYLASQLDAAFRVSANLKGPFPLPTLPPSFRVTNNRLFGQDSETMAVFGQVTWNIDPQWSLTLGLRATREEKKGHHHEFPTALYTDTPIPPPAGGPGANVHDVSAKRTEDQITPNAIVQWRPHKDRMIYFSVSQGFKGGGFDGMLSAPQATAQSRFVYRDEKVTAYELGGKFAFPDIGVEISTAAFDSKFKDLQVSSLLPGDGTLFRVGNAASAISKGIEANLVLKPTRSLRLSAAATYLKARYDRYQDAPCYGGQTAATGCIGLFQDLSGKPLQYAPTWKASVDGQYVWPLNHNLEFSWFARLDYSDSYALTTDLDPLSFQDSYVKVDSSLAIEAADGKWRVSIIGQNLTNELTTNFGNTGAGPPGASVFRFAEPPRSYRLQARIAF
ncbi:MAG: TonB-dependent receptor [Gammaproteobacteria bacterium]|nr:TonB-dependent receptor [Gammaproteobacteria bacterium]